MRLGRIWIIAIPINNKLAKKTSTMGAAINQ